MARLRRAVGEAEVGGIKTTLPFHRAMLAEPAFVEATDLSTTWVDAHWDGPRARASAVRTAAIAAGLAALAGDRPTGNGTAPSASGAGRAPVTGSAPADGAPGTGAWRAGGRARATDRWPA